VNVDEISTRRAEHGGGEVAPRHHHAARFRIDVRELLVRRSKAFAAAELTMRIARRREWMNGPCQLWPKSVEPMKPIV